MYGLGSNPPQREVPGGFVSQHGAVLAGAAPCSRAPPLRSAAHREPRRSARRPEPLLPCVPAGAHRAHRHRPRAPCSAGDRRTQQGPSAPVGRQHPLLCIQRFRSPSGKRVKTPEGGSSVAIPEPERAVRPLVPRAQPGAWQGSRHSTEPHKVGGSTEASAAALSMQLRRDRAAATLPSSCVTGFTTSNQPR